MDLQSLKKNSFSPNIPRIWSSILGTLDVQVGLVLELPQDRRQLPSLGDLAGRREAQSAVRGPCLVGVYGKPKSPKSWATIPESGLSETKGGCPEHQHQPVAPNYLPGKPVASNYGLPSMNYGLRQGTVARFSGYLALQVEFSDLYSFMRGCPHPKQCGSPGPLEVNQFWVGLEPGRGSATSAVCMDDMSCSQDDGT